MESEFVNHWRVAWRIGVNRMWTRAHVADVNTGGARGIGMRVLLIEDDSATAQSIELMLKSENFNVYTTDLGEEGVDLGKLYDYDIILLDLNLRRQGEDADPHPLRSRRHRGQGARPRLRRRRLYDQALPQG